MNRTTNGFDTINLLDFTTMLGNICGKMTGNANIPDQQPAVTALMGDKNQFLVLAQNEDGGGKAAILERDSKRAAIVSQLRNLGNAVTAVAAGDLVILESSGYPVTKDRQPTPPLEKPEAPKVSVGINNDEIECIAKKQVGNERISYMISSDPAAEANWKTYSSSRSKYLFTNLVSSQRYYIKYALCGVRDQEVVSDTVSYIPQ